MDEEVAFNQEFIVALADDTRQRIIMQVAARGELASGEIAASLAPMTHATVSHHLKILHTGGVLTRRKAGKQVFYDIDRSGMRKAISKLSSLIYKCCSLDDRIELPNRREPEEASV